MKTSRFTRIIPNSSTNLRNTYYNIMIIKNMTKGFTCSDVGVDCDWSVDANTEEELMTKIAEHAKEHHGFDPIPPELVEKVKAAIKDR